MGLTIEQLVMIFVAAITLLVLAAVIIDAALHYLHDWQRDHDTAEHLFDQPSQGRGQ